MSDQKKNTPNQDSANNPFKKIVYWFKDAFVRSFSGHSKETWIWIILFMIISMLSGIILLLQYQDETFVYDKVVRWFIIPILELGVIGIIIFIVFMGIQGILVPIPSELVLLSTGLIWGIQGGTILGIIGSMFAGILTYYIAMMGGRPIIEKFLGEETLTVIDKFITKYGAGTILIARAFPFMAFDPISYASGFLKINFRVYVTATFIGSIIRCIFYAWLGSTLSDRSIIDLPPEELDNFIQTGASQFNSMFLMIVIVLGLAFVLYQFALLPYLKKKEFGEKKNN